MTVKHRMFFSFVDEGRWLEKMNSDGLELMRAAPFKFEFEKTDTQVQYEYVPLCGGKSHFSVLNYKKKDKNLKAVYAKSDMALFKKPKSKGKSELLTNAELFLAFARYKSSISINALIMLHLLPCLFYWRAERVLRFCIFPRCYFCSRHAGIFIRAARTEQYMRGLRKRHG